MLPADLQAFKAQLGEPLYTFATKSEKLDGASFKNTGQMQTGTIQYWTVPKAGDYLFVADGASGSMGTNVRADSPTVYEAAPGKAARVLSQVTLNKGDVIMILVGHMGNNVRVPANDGASGAGGGATFVLRQIPVITDAKCQITYLSKNWECLVCAAGGSGTKDLAYTRDTKAGLNAADMLYTKESGVAFSPTTTNPAVSSSVWGSVRSLAQIASYDGYGAYYSRGGNIAYGGFGGGAAGDDSPGCGGGWTMLGTAPLHNASSFALNGGTLVIKAEEGHGSVDIIGIPNVIELEAWWQPVFDRTQQDCDAGNAKGSLSVADLNRIELNLRYLQAVFYELNYISDFLENAEFPWSRQKLLLQQQLNNLEQNILNMQSAFTKYPDIPPIVLTAANGAFDFAKLNLIEYSLYDLHWLIDKMLRMGPIANNSYVGNY